MAKSTKIEQRTKDFNAALKKLDELGKCPSNTELMKVLGLKSSSSISEIKAERQNIQAKAWIDFQKRYRSELSEGSKTGDGEGEHETGVPDVNIVQLLQQQLELLKKMDENIRNVDQTVLDNREHILLTESLSRTVVYHSAHMEQRHFGGDYEKIAADLNAVTATTYKTLRQLSSDDRKHKVA